MGILCVWTGGELDLLVGALERDIEPCEESMDVCRLSMLSTQGEYLRDQRDGQSFRVAVREKGAWNVRSSFLAVKRSICYRTRVRQPKSSENGNLYLDQTRIGDDSFQLDGID